MYRDYNDSELLYLIGESNEEAQNILYGKYKYVIDLKIKKYSSFANKVGLEHMDLMQEGMIGLNEAIQGFKEQKGIKFSTFSSICIERQILTALTKANRNKHKILNESLSLDNTYDEDLSLLDFVFDDTMNPEKTYLNQETLRELYEMISDKLTSLEKNVFDLKLKGYGYNDISEKLNKSYKSVDTALQRIKKKIKSILDETC